MNMPLIALAPALMMIAACSSTPKEPDGEPSVGFVAVPTKAMAKRTGNSLKELHVGFGLYLRHCGQCHRPIMPQEISDEHWHVATPRMAWNANLSDQEEDALLKYLLAARSEPQSAWEAPAS